MNKSGTRWALVTFATGITCAVLGHHVNESAGILWLAFPAFVAFFFALFGGMSISNAE